MPSASVKAPLLDSTGKASKQITLDGAVFSAEIKPHLVHEVVRAEMNANRAGTRGAKSRGMVSGGRSKPWRQKGTGRARIGTTRAPHWTGGGVAFPPTMRSFAVKVNRKVQRAALRAALAAHVREGTLALVDASTWSTPSTREAGGLLAEWGKDLPLVLVVTDEEDVITKSFRNIPGVAVTTPHELEVSAVVWARSLLVSEAALPLVEARAGKAAQSTSAEPTSGEPEKAEEVKA